MPSDLRSASPSSSDTLSLEKSFIPEEPLHPDGAAFFAQVTGMLDGQPKAPEVVEEALSGWDELLAKIASELYRIGSMLLGEGEETIDLIEGVVTNLDLTACQDHAEARHNSRLALGAESIAILELRNPGSLGAPLSQESDTATSCIEDDDLEAAGVTRTELERMLEDRDSQHLRVWLESLAEPLRVIFVLRSIANLSTVEIAVLLAENGGPSADTWTPDAVRSAFRLALCSLASQLIHSTVAK